MRIGFDAKRLFNNFTGLGNYSRTLVSNLVRLYPEHEYFLFTPRITERPRTEEFLDSARYTIVQPARRRALWRSFGLLKAAQRCNLDLYHGLSHELPFGIQGSGIASVVTMHDLIFKFYPRDYPFIDRLVYDFKFRYACRNADRVIAISQQTAQDVKRFYGTDNSKINVIYQSCDPRFAELEHLTSPLTSVPQIPDKYLLHVGSIISRKNLSSIVSALALLRDRIPHTLVVVGDGKKYKTQVEKQIRKAGLKDRVHFYSGIPFSLFPALYANAEIFIYPSLHEGFGIPVIEALHAGTPVITSNQSALPEAGGPGSMLVDPRDPEAIARQILDILNNPAKAKEMITLGKKHVRNFDQGALTHQLMQVYNDLCA